GGLGAGPDRPHLHDEPAAPPRRRGPAAGRRARPRRRGRRLRRGAAALRRPAPAGRRGRVGHAQGLVPPVRRGARRRGGRALPGVLEAGRRHRGTWAGRDALVPVLLGEDAPASADALLAALRAGAREEEVAGAVAYAAALRVARFHTVNEFGDWDTALHTFT